METPLDADGVLRLADSDPSRLPEVWRTILSSGGKRWLRHLAFRALPHSAHRQFTRGTLPPL
eukprot:11204779-Lingulodinium_polyedra.AAC.1